MRQEVVEAAIIADIAAIQRMSPITGEYWGIVTVQGRTVHYRAYPTIAGKINVGNLLLICLDSMDPRFREMNILERRLVDRLLATPFPGSRDLAIQLRNSLVCSIDQNGSLDFLVSTNKKVSLHNPIPVEGEAEDSDGITIHLLLHVIEGIARGIEVYKEDSSDVIKFPDPTELRVISPP